MTEEKVRNAHRVALESANEPSVKDDLRFSVYTNVFHALLAPELPEPENDDKQNT